MSEDLDKFEQSMDNNIKYPFYWYKSEEDILYYLEKAQPHYFEKTHTLISLIRNIDTNIVIGFEIKNAKQILEKINSGEINDGNVLKNNIESNKNLFDEINEYKEQQGKI